MRVKSEERTQTYLQKGTRECREVKRQCTKFRKYNGSESGASRKELGARCTVRGHQPDLGSRSLDPVLTISFEKIQRLKANHKESGFTEEDPDI